MKNSVEQKRVVAFVYLVVCTECAMFCFMLVQKHVVGSLYIWLIAAYTRCFVVLSNTRCFVLITVVYSDWCRMKLIEIKVAQLNKKSILNPCQQLSWQTKRKAQR